MTFWTGNSVKVALVDFAKKAHAHFAEHLESHTFTSGGDIACGEPIAIRWAFDTSTTWSVLVFEVGSTPVLVEEF